MFFNFKDSWFLSLSIKKWLLLKKKIFGTEIFSTFKQFQVYLKNGRESRIPQYLIWLKDWKN